MKADLRVRLRNLAEQFRAASTQWPNLNSILVSWPEDALAPAELEQWMLLITHGTITKSGDIHFRAPIISGISYDSSGARFCRDSANALVLHRSFGRSSGDPRVVSNPEEHTACGDRLKALVNEGYEALKSCSLIAGFPKETRDWLNAARIRGWQLVIHGTISGWERRIGKHTGYVIDDLFLASANAVESWLESGDLTVANKRGNVIGEKKTRRRRGRTPATDAKADSEVAVAWRSGQHRTYEDLGGELGKSGYEVKKALDRDRHRRKKS